MKKTTNNMYTTLKSRGIKEAEFLIELREIITSLKIPHRNNISFSIETGFMSVILTYETDVFKRKLISKLKKHKLV